MNKLIPTTLIAALAMIVAAPLADARPHHRGKHHKHHYKSHVYVSGYRSCGTPIYQERYVRHYRSCGTPVWGHRVVAPPRHYRHARPRYHRDSYCPPPRPVCPPPRYHRSGGRVIIQGILGL
ncbi:MAG TPA: hypothetical protein VLO11_11855 [Luteolibacter sp.]|nr:hypothetical protein [Luteolibacter sp.]